MGEIENKYEGERSETVEGRNKERKRERFGEEEGKAVETKLRREKERVGGSKEVSDLLTVYARTREFPLLHKSFRSGKADTRPTSPPLSHSPSPSYFSLL